MDPDTLELCLDVLVPATLSTMWLDHTAYIERHIAQGDLQSTMSLLQQDADAIFAHLRDTHFKGDPAAAKRYIASLNHIPF